MVLIRRAAAALALGCSLVVVAVGPAAADRIKNPTAVFSGLDKITGRIISFEVATDETVQFGALQLTARVCYSRPQTETPNTTAFVEVDEVTFTNEQKRIFGGWMFASSPGLHGIEHPVYDLWLTECKGGTESSPSRRKSIPPKNSSRRTQRPRSSANSNNGANSRVSSRGRQACRGSQASPASLDRGSGSSPTTSAPSCATRPHRRSRDGSRTSSSNCSAAGDRDRVDRVASAGNRRQRLGARDRLAASPGPPIGLVGHGLGEHRLVGFSRNLDGTELGQVWRDKLRVEEPEAARAEPRHEMHQRDLRGVGLAMEHALAEERRPEADAVEAADELARRARLHRVAMADVEELAIEPADAVVDPGLGPPRPGARRPAITASKSWSTRTSNVPARTVRARRRGTWNPSSGMMPRSSGSTQIEAGVLGALRHREDAAGIGLEQELRRDLDCDRLAAGIADASTMSRRHECLTGGESTAGALLCRPLAGSCCSCHPLPSCGQELLPASGCRSRRPGCRRCATRSRKSGMVVSMPSTTNSSSARRRRIRHSVRGAAVDDQLADQASRSRAGCDSPDRRR